MIRKISEGAKADIFYYVQSDGVSPVKNAIDALTPADRKKVMYLLHRFAEFGEIRIEEKFKHEKGEIYAFKSFQIRILCFLYPGAKKKSIVLTNLFIKKQNKLPKDELEKAESIYRIIVKN